MAVKRFKYRLQKLLEQKIKEEDDEKKKLGQIIERRKQAELYLQHLINTLTNERQELRDKQMSGKIFVNEVLMFHVHFKKLDRDIAQQRIVIQRIDMEIEEQKEVVRKAMQERKTFEKHKEKKHEEFIQEMDLEEQKFIDELATIRHGKES